MNRIQVSNNRHFLVEDSGKPFFWLGDTAWELFHRVSREEAKVYFRNRALKGFSVIQAVALAEFDGLNVPNIYGDFPLIGNDPSQPNEAYFSYVDELVRMAHQFGLYIGILPTWGDKVTSMWGIGPAVFTPTNAFTYGNYLGNRYKDQENVIFILGGDRPATTNDQDYRQIWRQMANGIDAGAQKRILKTYHPMGGYSSSFWLQSEDWLDMHMLQSGHGGGHDVAVWDMVAHDYALQPPRPVIDAEPNYEDHPVSPWPTWDPANGYFDDYDVRKQIYRSVFAGACGVTYGHHSIWQFITPTRTPITHPLINQWGEALDRPASFQVGYLRKLIESRPFLSRIPAQEMIVSEMGTAVEHIQATRDQAGSYAMVYFPTEKTIHLNLEFIDSDKVRAWWFDPREGCSHLIGDINGRGVSPFRPPKFGPDWILVLDNLRMSFPIPASCSVEINNYE